MVLSHTDHVHLVLYDLTIQAYPLQRRYGQKLQSHWSSLVQHDPACLQATICVAATNTALTVGEFPLRSEKQSSSLLLLDTFHHRGETIRLVNEGLSSPPKASSDELIAAVSILLTIEVCMSTGQTRRPLLTSIDCVWKSRLPQSPPCRVKADGLHAQQLRRRASRRSVPDLLVSLTAGKATTTC
jgi:hypothetical protein